jgi:hypothetical protein
MAQAAIPVARQFPKRYPYGKDATIAVAGEMTRCVILDISTTGAALLCPARPAVGSPMLLTVPDIGELEGLVTHHLADGFGITFEFPEEEREDIADHFTYLADLGQFL